MKKVFEFGKVAYNNNKKENLVTVEVNLNNKEGKGFCFSVSGRIWNRIKTDCLSGGQILDEIKELIPNNETFNFIFDAWNKYHLNDLNAGTIKQSEALKDFKGDYTQQCDYLESLGLLSDDGYKYGSAWLFREIPKDDLNKIIELLK